MKSRGLGDVYKRQIMDISDDIAYSVHDIEDGIQTGELDPDTLGDSKSLELVFETTTAWYGDAVGDELENAWKRIRALPQWLASFDGSYRDMARLKNMTSQLIGRFCSAVSSATLQAAGTGPLHRYDADLVIPEATRAEIKLLKGIAATYMMAPRETEPIYLAQRTTIYAVSYTHLTLPTTF